MIRLRLSILLVVALAAAGCGGSGDAPTPEDYNTRKVRFPNGREIRAELMIRDEDMRRGMMFRDRMEPDRGMLFIHSAPGNYPYWMYQVKIPLDIIWLDKDRRIVEILPNVPPCAAASSKDCPTYGGKFVSRFTLELAGGGAAQYGLKPGDILDF
jgi:uncharacterized membrane protein (UPF0127 family)